MGVLVKSGCEAGLQAAGTKENRGAHPGEQQGDEEWLKQNLTLKVGTSGHKQAKKGEGGPWESKPGVRSRAGTLSTARETSGGHP